MKYLYLSGDLSTASSYFFRAFVDGAHIFYHIRNNSVLYVFIVFVVHDYPRNMLMSWF